MGTKVKWPSYTQYELNVGNEAFDRKNVTSIHSIKVHFFLTKCEMHFETAVFSSSFHHFVLPFLGGSFCQQFIPHCSTSVGIFIRIL